MGDGAAGRADLFDLTACFHQGVAAAGFGQAIGVDIARVPEIVGESADAQLRRLLAAADRPLQAGDVIAFTGGAGEHRGGHDRRKPRRVQPFRFDRGQRLLRLEVAVDGEHAAMPEHGDAGQVERADMVERTDHQQSRLGIQPQRQGLIGRFPVDVLISEHHALRAIRGARCVHQPHQVARLRGCIGAGAMSGAKPGGAGLRGFVEQHDRHVACRGSRRTPRRRSEGARRNCRRCSRPRRRKGDN